MAVTELLTFTASDALAADVNLFKEPLKTIAKAEGFINMFYGLQSQDSHIGYLIINWQTYDDHQNFMKHSSYPGLLTAFKPLHTGPLVPVHIDFDADVTSALAAPATEFVVYTLKPNVSSDEFKTKIKPLRDEIDKINTFRGAALGEIRERKGSLSFVLGWDSIKAQYDAMANYSKDAINAVYAIANGDLKNSELIKYAA